MRFSALMAMTMLALAASGAPLNVGRVVPPRRPDPPPRCYPPKPPVQLHALTPRQWMKRHRYRVSQHAADLERRQDARLHELRAEEMRQEAAAKRAYEAWLRTHEGRQAKLQSNRERKRKRNERRRRSR